MERGVRIRVRIRVEVGVRIRVRLRVERGVRIRVRIRGHVKQGEARERPLLGRASAQEGGTIGDE